MRYAALLIAFVSLAVNGCEQNSGTVDGPSTTATTNGAPPPPPSLGPQAAPPPLAPQVVVERKSADAVLGVNAPNQKGADYEWSYARVLFTNYFGIRETVALGQVKQALAFFEANHGRKPKTNEEGMEAIKDIPLPELPDETYWYEFDPEAQELVVVHKELKQP